MQRARDVGRRYHNRVRLTQRIRFAVEITFPLPRFVKPLLRIAVIKTGRQVFGGEFGSHRDEAPTPGVARRVGQGRAATAGPPGVVVELWWIVFVGIGVLLGLVRPPYFDSSLTSLYSTASTRAIQLASMMFSLTPTVPHTS